MGDVTVFVTADDRVRLQVTPGSPGAVPLVLSNSLGTDVTLWDTQVDQFAVHHSVWRYDTRGHGQSDVPAGESTAERLGHDLLAVIDATGADQVDLCGVSIGGLTALWVAIHAPHRIRRLVLANTAARIGSSELWTERIRAARADGMRPLATAAMPRWFTDAYRLQQPAVVARFQETMAGTSVDGYASCCAVLRDADLRAMAPQVGCPTLVVTGNHDHATPPDDGRWLAGQIRGARVLPLDAAHLSNVERADEFNAAVGRFLTSKDERDGR